MDFEFEILLALHMEADPVNTKIQQLVTEMAVLKQEVGDAKTLSQSAATLITGFGGQLASLQAQLQEALDKLTAGQLLSAEDMATLTDVADGLGVISTELTDADGTLRDAMAATANSGLPPKPSV